MDIKKQISTAKGRVTRVITSLEEQEGLRPQDLRVAVFERLLERLAKAEESYNEAYQSIPDPSEEDDYAQLQFLDALDDARVRIDHLKLVSQVHDKEADLLELLDYWESLEADDLRQKVDRDITSLQSQLDSFILLTRPRKLASSTHIKDLVKSLRIRVDKLKNAGTSSTSSSSKSTSSGPDSAGPMKQGIKSRTLPLPTYSGDLSDWRSFWRRFTEYLKRMPELTTDEQLTFLLECIKEPAAVNIIRDALRNGDSFESVEGRLKTKYDQPRRVFTDMAIKLKRIPEIHDTEKGTSTCSELATRFINIINKFGDGSASQLITAFFEAMIDDDLIQEWYRYIGDSEKVPHVEKLIEFMDHRSRILTSRPTESRSTPRSNFNKPSGKFPPPKSSPKERSKPVSLVASSDLVCKLCNGKEHALYYCDKFKTMDVPARQQFVSTSNHCYNCLGPGHSAKECHSRKSCKTCSGKHHSLLHLEGGNRSQATTTTSSTNRPAATPPETSLALPVPRPTAILWICQAVVDQNGRTTVVRGIIDPGSTISFITEKVVKSLKLQTTPMVTEVTGIGSTHAGTSKFETNILLRSPYELESPPINVRAAVIKSIVGDTPSTELVKNIDTSFTNALNLSDPNFRTPGGIDLLLGQDVIKNILRDGVVRSTKNDLYAINTVFGWVVGGCCDSPTDAVVTHVCCHASSPPTGSDNLLRAFWEAEEPPTTPLHTEEDQQALSHFHETHSRQEDGRYIVRLPKKMTDDKLGNSRDQALRRYIANRNSLVRKGKWEDFSNAVLEYGQLGHAELVPPADLDKPVSEAYYLPMHGVTKSISTTTKLRIVFDASATTPTGHSLNSLLLPGPTCYPLLTNILIRFRLPKVGVSADISKMFREVALHPGDRDLHRFLMEDETGNIRDWRMVRLTFGVTCSPFLATQVLHQLAKDYQTEFPAASHAIMESFYVDDFLSGADTVEAADNLRRSLNELLSKGKMTLRKWRTNSAVLRATIPDNLLEAEDVQLIQAPAECHKALGVHWRTSTDTLHVATPKLGQDDTPTKRQVLSDVARTFDVLGWFTPVTITLKILLQRVWSLGLDWDHTLPSDLVCIWKQWRDDLHIMTNFAIPRCYFCPDKTVQALQLHGFCDASQMAIAAVVYVRCLYTDASVSVELVVAKSRVAPVKPQTIPKLELSAAVLLSKLLSTVKEELSIDISSVFAWSDSMITLGWIRTSPVRLKTFVANRVVQITDHLPPVHWRHVPTTTNPADVASRGTTARDLTHHELWWHGPDWLCLSPSHWPSCQESLGSTLPELKSFALTIQAEPVEKETILIRFSSFLHCVNVHARLFRFAANSKKTKELRDLSRDLSLDEINHAEHSIFRQHQHNFFPKEAAMLKSSVTVPRSSSLHSLLPFMDKNGLLRVGGRLQQSNLAYQQKHPIIVFRKSHLAFLLVTHLHLSNQHAGPTMLMGLLSQQYYIPGARSLVRIVSHRCVTCQKEYAKTATQQMGQLPQDRVRPSPPFSKTGTDFAGPLLLRKGHTRKPVQVKGYVCLFVCLSTHAVHLELVMDLTTEAFLSAFRRFTARRGCPEEVLSDNGSNYVGANHELARLYDLLTAETSTSILSHYFTNARIRWKFIPGRAPHFGGLWESGIKSAKTLLRKIVGSHPLTVEECMSVLVDIEATLNSRPLCSLDSSPEDGIEVLTPGHFLVGRSLKAPPQPPSEQLSITSRKRWNLCLKMTADFWTRWSSEYLQTLQRRNKWTTQSANLKVGQVVLLKDQDLFLRTWPLAVIEQVHPGQDGLVRAVTIRTNKGTYRRPIVKIVPLLDSSDNQNRPTFSPGEDVQATP